MKVMVGRRFHIGKKEVFRIMFEGGFNLDIACTEDPYLGGDISIENQIDLRGFLDKKIAEERARGF